MYLSHFKKKGFEGSVDMDLAISLYEYGLLHRTYKNHTAFVHGVHFNSNTNEWIEFENADMTEDEFIELIEPSWFELNNVLSFIGQTKNQWLKLPLHQRVSDCLDYYGYENIFGSSYGGFEITTNKAGHRKEHESKYL